MQADIIALEQKLDLNTSQLSTFIVMRLPDGKEYRAEASTELAEALVGLNASGTQQPQVQAPVPDPISVPPEMVDDGESMVFGGFEEQQEEDDPFIEWAALPDDQLAPKMKQMLTSNDVPASLRASQLVAIVDQLAEKMIQEHELRQQQQKKALAPPQDQVGVVQRVPHVAPARKVPMDEMGYPRVPQQDRDPGEVALHGTDEDGIAQV